MKFTIAAGILVAQSFPVISDNSAAVAADILVRPEAPGSNHHDDALVVVPQEEITSHVLQLPKLHGLKNQDARIISMTQKTSCDASSDAPDVGVLSCGLGYACVPAPDSTNVGGICVSTSRELQAEQNCYLCDYGQVLGYSKYSLPSGYQDFTCGDLALAAYGVEATITTEQCDGSLQFVQAAGCCVTYDCNPCGGDETFNPNALLANNDFTCGEITPVMNETLCASNTPYLSGLCCGGGDALAPTPVPSILSTVPNSVISGIPTAVTDAPTAAVADTPTTGEVPMSVVPSIPPIAELTDPPTAAAPGGTPTAAVPDTPTAEVPDAPTAEVPDAPDAPAAPDSATIMWSTNTFVLAVGLAAATAAGLLLN